MYSSSVTPISTAFYCWQDDEEYVQEEEPFFYSRCDNNIKILLLLQGIWRFFVKFSRNLAQL